jgi:hypothetical protein
VTRYHNPAWTEDGRFRAALDDVIIIPLVLVTLAANKILRSILSILMRLLDYAFRSSRPRFLVMASLPS